MHNNFTRLQHNILLPSYVREWFIGLYKWKKETNYWSFTMSIKKIQEIITQDSWQKKWA